MHRGCISLILVTCTCLIVLQTVGVHMHVSSINEQTGVHALPHSGALDHCHSADRDVPLLEKLGLGGFKLLPLIISVFGLGATAFWRRVQSYSPVSHSAKRGRRSRWRPPLRAPPLA